MANPELNNNFNYSKAIYLKDDSKKIESPVILLPEICPCETDTEAPFKTTVTPNDTDSSGKPETINIDSSLKLGSSKLIHSFLADVPVQDHNEFNDLIPLNNSTKPTNQKIELESFIDATGKAPLKTFYSENANGSKEKGIITELNINNFNIITDGKNSIDSAGTVTNQKSASVTFFPTPESDYFSSENKLTVVNTRETALDGNNNENNEISLMYGNLNIKSVKNSSNDGSASDAYDLTYNSEKTSFLARKKKTSSGYAEIEAKLNKKVETYGTDIGLTYSEINDSSETSYVSNVTWEQEIRDSKLSASYTSKSNDNNDFEVAYNYKDTIISKYNLSGNNKYFETVYSNTQGTDSINKFGIKHSLNTNTTEIFGEGTVESEGKSFTVKSGYTNGKSRLAYLEASLNNNTKDNEKLSVRLNHDSAGSSAINAEYSREI